jgi:protein involved in polysaccharide export with SLBB domain
MPTFARHRRPGRGLLFFILIAAAVFWTGISVGIVMGRRHRLAHPTTGPVPSAPNVVPSTAPAGQLRPGDRIQLRLAGGSGPSLAETTLTVDSQGNVAIPVIGTIRAMYLTPVQLEQTIGQAYKARNLMSPGTIEVVPVPTTGPSGR